MVQFRTDGCNRRRSIRQGYRLSLVDKAGVSYDVAFDVPFQGGVNWQEADPENYSHIIFVCGPFGNGWPVTDFLDHFSGIKLIGINLSMLQALEEWNPFDLLLERDSTRRNYPELVFLSEKKLVPVIGKILVEPQKEYGGKAKHQLANQMISELLAKNQCAVVPIDTEAGCAEQRRVAFSRRDRVTDCPYGHGGHDTSARHGAGVEKRCAGIGRRCDQRRRKSNNASTNNPLAQCFWHRRAERKGTARGI